MRPACPRAGCGSAGRGLGHSARVTTSAHASSTAHAQPATSGSSAVHGPPPEDEPHLQPADTIAQEGAPRITASADGLLVTPAVRVASEWTWRLLVIALGVYALIRLVSGFSELLVPILISLLVAALLHPLVELLARSGVPRALSALLSILLLVLLVAALFALVGQQAANGFGDLRDQAVAGLDDLQRRLAESRLHLSSTAIDDLVTQAENAAQDNRGVLVSGALGVASTATRIAEGLFIIFFSTFFFLSSGRGIWAWLLRLMPKGAQAPLDAAGRSGWVTLTHYVRATLIVAVVDGLGVGIGAALLGVPLAIPLGVVVFLGAFIPVVIALAMLGVVLIVQQVEAHGLQPFLLGRAVSVHPLGVILAITAGATVAGIPGALFAVPLAAVTNTMVTSVARFGKPADDPGEDIANEDAPMSPDRPQATDVQEETAEVTTSSVGGRAGR